MKASAEWRPATKSEAMTTILRYGVFLKTQPPMAKLPWSEVSTTRNSHGLALLGAVRSLVERDRADVLIGPVALHQLPRLGQADVGLGLVVLLEELDLTPTRLVADLGEVELDALTGLLAVDGDDAGVGQQEAHLDRRPRRLPRDVQRDTEQRCHDQSDSRHQPHRVLRQVSACARTW